MNTTIVSLWLFNTNLCVKIDKYSVYIGVLVFFSSPGSDVVDWLYHHVEGFTDRREARKYASNLLKAGYIRHTVNKITFSEQCYYIFGDLCGSMFSSPSSFSRLFVYIWVNFTLTIYSIGIRYGVIVLSLALSQIWLICLCTIMTALARLTRTLLPPCTTQELLHGPLLSPISTPSLSPTLPTQCKTKPTAAQEEEEAAPAAHIVKVRLLSNLQMRII